MTTSAGAVIQRLDDFTVAQIRAGEAIEHPAAVVKEAIENAIDAGATAIRVDIRAGGKREIRITDNGSGIPADQIELAFERHTTSKLRQAADLFSVLTLGFRGEALASMAAVAQVTCISRTADAEVGLEVRLARGTVIARTPRGCAPGTTLIIQNLFGEVPVRLKFLKSDAAEAARVTEAIQHAALSRPAIRWTLTSDGREQIQTSGNGDARDVMLVLYGAEVARDLIPVTDQDGDGELATAISGWISPPRRTHGTRKGMHLFVNGRWIEATSAIGAAVEAAYFHRLPSGRRPFTCLAITVEPGAVDVNIHPSKRDVKLQFNDRVIGLIGRAVRTALSEAPGGMSSDEPAPDSDVAPPASDQHELPSSASDGRSAGTPSGQSPAALEASLLPSQFLQAAWPSDEEVEGSPPAPPRALPLSPPPVTPGRQATRARGMPGHAPSQEPPRGLARRGRASPSDREHTQAPVYVEDSSAGARLGEAGIAPPARAQPAAIAEPVSTMQERPGEPELVHPSSLGRLVAMAQHEQTWILARGPGMLAVIDQHRAHERVIYERLLRETAAQPLPPQPVAPREVALPPALAALLVDHCEALAVYGLILAPATTGRLVVTGSPAPLTDADTQAVLMELGRWLSAHGGQSPEDWHNHVLATIACHASIQAGQALTMVEMQELLVKLAQCTTMDVCPHGFPLTHVITTTWLEQHFAPAG